MADQYEQGEIEVLKDIEDIVKTHSSTQKQGNKLSYLLCEQAITFNNIYWQIEK